MNLTQHSIQKIQSDIVNIATMTAYDLYMQKIELFLYNYYDDLIHSVNMNLDKHGQLIVKGGWTVT